MIRKIDAPGILKKFDFYEHFLLLDVESLQDYDRVHLPRAIHLPLSSDFASFAASVLPAKGTELVIYDNGGGEKAWKAARILHEMGWYTLYVYGGGRREWMERTLPEETWVNPSPAQAFNPMTPSPGAPDI